MAYQNLGACVYMSPSEIFRLCTAWAEEYFGKHASADVDIDDLSDRPCLTVSNLKPEDREKVIDLIKKHNANGPFTPDDLETLTIEWGFTFPYRITMGILSELAPKIGLQSIGYIFVDYTGYSIYGSMLFVEKEVERCELD